MTGVQTCALPISGAVRPAKGGGQQRAGGPVGGLEAGTVAEIGGKPERHLFEMAIGKVGGRERLAMVGDRISSDIDGGRAAGLATVLVLSGTSSRADAEAAEPAPDHVLENLAGLLR